MKPAEETESEHGGQPQSLVIDPSDQQLVRQLCTQAFTPDRVDVGRLTDINQGRGAFSTVLRAELTFPDRMPEADPFLFPETVAAKLAVRGANGEAAISGGAYAREALAYRSVVANSPIRTPKLHALHQPQDGTCALLLEDLGRYRAADQLDGLAAEDALLVTSALRRFHRAWVDSSRLRDLTVRRNTVSGFLPAGLEAGLLALETTWADQVTPVQRRVFAGLVAARIGLIERFAAAPATLCHGDPRADNLVFDDDADSPNPADTVDGSGGDGRAAAEGAVILFDWQQMAIQHGEADLAWLAATSLEVDVRRLIDQAMVTAYGGDFDRYRLGFALPGLAVLMLAQREFPTERAQRFVSVSLQRIATALDDLEVAALG